MHHRRFHDPAVTLIGLSLAALSAAPAVAAEECGCLQGWIEYASLSQPGRIYDPETGQELRNFAPHRRVDYDHMRLTIDIPDMNEPTFTAVEELTFSPIGVPVGTISLNAIDFEFGEITGLGAATVESTTYDGETLQISFAEPLEPGDEAGVRLEYTLRDPVDGLFWTVEAPEWPDRPAQIHTQGQPETNRHWFAAHDFPNERLTTEIIITVPEGFLASANGRLVSEKTSRGRTTWHWLQDKDHTSYLVTLVVGKFDVVDVGTSELPMPVYVPPGRAEDVERTYGMTAEMVELFETLFDEPYPWDRYAQLVVWNFGAGGMENTSATTMYDTAIYTEHGMRDDDLDGLIAHELGHQWFGDLITCNSWADIWLNEGFATYSTALWYEHRDGYDEGYLRTALSNFDRVTRADRLSPGDENAGRRPGMVSREYRHPWDVFRRRANPYPKGSSVLHMLRMKLGDDLFFKGLAEYVDLYKFDTAETDEFRRVMEDVSGLSLDRFFEQWVYRPGVPELDVSASYDLDRGELLVTVEQTQRVDEFVPAFFFDLPVRVVDAGGGVHEMTIAVDQKRHQRAMSLEAAPRMVVVDPEMTVLSSVELNMPEAWLENQLLEGPTTPARILAARALAEASPAVVDSLTDALYDTGLHHSVRSAAAAALGDHEAFNELGSVAMDRRDDPRVRADCLQALYQGEADDEAHLNNYRRLAMDRSDAFGVQSMALRCLGRMGEDGDLGILRRALEVESRDDTVRQSAIRAIREMDLPESLDLIIPYSKFGNLNRTRPVAIGSIAALAEHDREKAYEAVAPLLDDSEDRTRQSAARALVGIEDERGVERLRRAAREADHPIFAELCREMASDLAAALGRDQGEIELRRKIDTLEQRIEELEAEKGAPAS